MENLFVPYEIALKLKELGFDEKCFKCWSVFPCAVQNKEQLNDKPDDWAFTNIKAPLYQQTINWFDDVHKIRIDLTHCDVNGSYNYTIWKWNFDNQLGKWQRIKEPTSFTNRIERNNKAIEEAIKLINV